MKQLVRALGLILVLSVAGWTSQARAAWPGDVDFAAQLALPGWAASASAIPDPVGGAGEIDVAFNPPSWRILGGFGLGVLSGGVTLGVGVLLVTTFCDGSLGCIGLAVLAMMASYGVYVATVPIGVRFGATLGTGRAVSIWPLLAGSVLGALVGGLTAFLTEPFWDGVLGDLASPTGPILSATFVLTLVLVPPVVGAAIAFELLSRRSPVPVGAAVSIEGGRILAGVPVPVVISGTDRRAPAAVVPLLRARF